MPKAVTHWLVLAGGAGGCGTGGRLGARVGDVPGRKRDLGWQVGAQCRGVRGGAHGRLLRRDRSAYRLRRLRRVSAPQHTLATKNYPYISCKHCQEIFGDELEVPFRTRTARASSPSSDT